MSWEDLLPRPGQGSGIPEAILAGQQAQANIGATNAQTQLVNAQLQGVQNKAARDQQRDLAVNRMLSITDPRKQNQAILDLMAQYPDDIQAWGKIQSGKDEEVKRADLGWKSGVISAIDGKQMNVAVDMLTKRIAADEAAGYDTTQDKTWLEAAKRGDTNSITYLRGALAGSIAASDPDKFDKFLEATGGTGAKRYVVGRALVDTEGKALYRDPDPGFTLSPGQQRFAGGEGGAATPGGTASGGQYRYGWTPRARNGGDNADNVVDNKMAGMATALGVGVDDDISKMSPLDIAKALTLSEGSAGSLADRNNNPGNLTDPKTGQFRKFATKEAGLGAAAAQVARNLKRGQRSIRTMVEGLPVGGGAPQAGGGPIASVPGAPKPQATPMTPAEVAAEGLDPSMVYYRGTDGIPKAVSGQTRSNAQLKPWPSKTLDARITNDASIQNIDRALTLLSPKNNSAEAKAARGGVGFGTGALGDTFSNYNNPDGVPIRALLGQISGIIIKDISGAAVTGAEWERIRKWIPLASDPVNVINYKLQNLKREIGLRNQVMDQTADSQGYKPFSRPGGKPAAPATSGWGKATRVQ